jgi:hypothetical protein
MKPPTFYQSSKDLPRYWREYISELVDEKSIERFLKERRRDFDGKSLLEVLNSPDGLERARWFLNRVGDGIPYLVGERPPWLDERREQEQNDESPKLGPKGLLGE